MPESAITRPLSSSLAKCIRLLNPRVHHDSDCEQGIHRAHAFAEQNKPVIVDVKIDYSKRTRFTKGIVKTNLARFTIGSKARFVGCALLRKLAGYRFSQPCRAKSYQCDFNENVSHLYIQFV